MGTRTQSFDQIVADVVVAPRTIVVAHALGTNVVRPLLQAVRSGFAHAIFVGPHEGVQSLIERIDPEIASSIEVVDAASEMGSAETAVELVREKKASVLVQGRVRFRDLRAAVEAEEGGLGIGRALSGLFLFEDPRPDQRRLLAITDHIVHPDPGEVELRQAIENAVYALQKLGFEYPNVALLSGTNRVMEEMESTRRAERITQAFTRGVLEGCTVDGPFTLDVAIDRARAEARQIAAPVAGRADLLVAPRLETARILVDALHWLTGVKAAQVLLGASAPIVVTSRADRPEDRLRSVQLASRLV